MAAQNFDDPRRAVTDSWTRQVSLEELRAPLPFGRAVTEGRAAGYASPREVDTTSFSSPSFLRRNSETRKGGENQAYLLGRLCSSNLVLAITQICGDKQLQAKVTTPEPPRRWYRVHPITNCTYFVRPDAGLRGRIPGYGGRGADVEPDAPAGAVQVRVGGCPGGREDSAQPVRSSRHVRRRPSLPAEVERRVGLDQESVDSFMDSTCKICYDSPSDVVVLPCKHGGICGKCLKRHMLSKPAHKGGGTCPLCRRVVKEVIQIYREAVLPHSYGYAIKAATFGRSRD